MIILEINNKWRLFMINEDLEYRMACTEVLEILKHMPRRKVEKIPENVIKSMQRLKRYDYCNKKK